MVEVIDFDKLSTHLTEQRDPSIVTTPSNEQLAQERSSMNRMFVVGGVIIVFLLGIYFFFNHDSSASGTESNAFQAETSPIFTSIQREFKNLKSVSCDEGERKDCVSYIFTFYPDTQDQNGNAAGLSSADVGRLGEYFNVILQSKLRHLSSRNTDLTFKIISTNISSTDGESRVTYMCREYHEQIKCEDK